MKVLIARIVGCVGSLVFLLGHGLEARTWTNSEGKEIEADYVSHTEDVVKLQFKGKEIDYELSKLSEGDREWLKEKDAEQAAEGAAREKEVAELLGRRKEVPIDGRLYEDKGDYFKVGERRAWIREHEKGAGDSTGDLDVWLKRDMALDKCLIYCPKSYDGTEAYGVLLFINPAPSALIRNDWEQVLDRHKLIGVSAYGVGNYEGKGSKKINPHPYRVSLSLDAMATVQKHYKVDANRRYVGGTSGGGHIAFTIAALYPELFRGAISSAAQSYLPAHFPGFDVGDFKNGKRKMMKWIVVSGKKDQNYPVILETGKVWEKEKLDYRFLDVPAMGHTAPAAGPLEEALKWIGL